MSLTNSQPRFAVESDTGTVFCYLTNRHYPPEGEQKLPDGTWDMAKVAELVKAGKPIQPALMNGTVFADGDKVSKADEDFAAAIEAKKAEEAKAAAAT